MKMKWESQGESSWEILVRERTARGTYCPKVSHLITPRQDWIVPALAENKPARGWTFCLTDRRGPAVSIGDMLVDHDVGQWQVERLGAPMPDSGLGDQAAPERIHAPAKLLCADSWALRQPPNLQSWRTTLRSEVLICRPPLYLMKPSFLNLFMKKFTRERVVPTISASISCDTLGSTLWGLSSLP